MKSIFKLIGLIIFLFPLNLMSVHYVIKDLGTLSNESSLASGINKNNVIVGMTESKEKSNYLWDPNNGLMLLPYTSCYQSPYINNKNEVVGLYWHKTNHWFAANERSKHIFILGADSSFQDVEPPSKWEKQLLADWMRDPTIWDKKEIGIIDFNDKGQILIGNSFAFHKMTEFAIWDQGEFTFLNKTTPLDVAYGVNNHGIILGCTSFSPDATPKVVLYDPKNNTTQVIGEDKDYAYRAQNDEGQVILVQMLYELDEVKGFVWDISNGLVELGNFIPLGLNNCGQMIGLQPTEDKKQLNPCLWNNGEIINLNEKLGIGNSDSPWSKIEAITSINDNGYIIGQGLYNGKKHAFVLIPE